MYFTRDPVIETIITAKDGHKLVLRSTKIASQEPFVVDSVEVVSLSGGCFFRSSERSQPFFIPISDYEVVEVRDARTTLKLPGVERGIKIAGGRSANLKSVKEKDLKNSNIDLIDEKDVVEISVQDNSEVKSNKEEKEVWKKSRKKKSTKEAPAVSFSREKEVKDSASLETQLGAITEDISHLQGNNKDLESKTKRFSLLPPPPMLISEVMGRLSETTTEDELSWKQTKEDISCIIE